jgi:ABC-type lipoprotein export system ATPase subunit
MYATIGNNLETGELITIGDIERRSGLYVLGKPGMGKSTLLVNLMCQDIGNLHGLFCLDPHGETISNLMNHGRAKLMADALLFDLEDDTHSFGIK